MPQLTGLKHSALTFSNVREFVKLRLVCLIGNGALMLPALSAGAPGCVDGPPNMAPEIWVELWQAYQAGDFKRAQAAQERATEVTNIVREFGLHATIKAVISDRLGIDCGDPRRPGLPLTDAQRTEVLRRTAGLGLEKVNVAA